MYVTGYSESLGTYYDYATVKYNSAGVQQWVARYSGPAHSDDYARAIAVDNQSNVYVTGGSAGVSSYSDFATIKYNSLGAEQWVYRYNGSDNNDDQAYAIAVDNQGNVYVTGYGKDIDSAFNYTTIKYDVNPDSSWVACYNGSGSNADWATALALDNQGNVYVTGYSYLTSSGYDYATIKYNYKGMVQWVQRYNGSGNFYDYPNALAVDGQDNVYVTGESYGSGSNYDYATIKYTQGTAVEEIIEN